MLTKQKTITMSKTRSRNIKRMKMQRMGKNLKERQLRKKTIDHDFNEFLKRNGMDKSQMSAKELSIARSAMKAEQESRYT